MRAFTNAAALKRRVVGRPEALLHHSDRGSQYASVRFQRLMAEHGIVCSMSRVGNVRDNTAVKSFFLLAQERDDGAQDVSNKILQALAADFEKAVSQVQNRVCAEAASSLRATNSLALSAIEPIKKSISLGGKPMTDMPVIIAGGGIGGLATALTLHQIGVPCIVFEASREMRPLGVGINLQPNAVRELYDLGITEEDLDRVGVPAREWALVGLNGNDIYSESRGLLAGYNWPQYAVHRGQFHVMLYDKVIARIGPKAVRLGSRVTGYRRHSDGSVSALVEHADGTTREVRGALLIGADGIHSTVRAQMHPAQPPIHWGGAVMWRGTTLAKPIRTGASFVGLGTHRHRIVFYPISHPDPRTGLAVINWIAEVTMDNREGWKQRGWFREVGIGDFRHHFENWTWNWLDVPAMLDQADGAFENPMIDRDPVPTWQDGPVALIGDAAHAMYPTGSNGASQAIVDARVLGAAMIEHEATQEALAAYDARLCGPISQLILRNRGAGPFGLLNMVDARCGGTFDNIDDVISPAERADFMAGYRAAAGFAIETLNKAPPTIPKGARVRTGAPITFRNHIAAEQG